ncbi:hypothetical protein AB0M95_20865 [Sphaerisporangium sp. NPDC051017]|uniref:hypothetical protein n=1 Tax=Sphaerisporangium sp. NPDC051017 TaxID=3154636 RepID=UPI0034483F4C
MIALGDKGYVGAGEQVLVAAGSLDDARSAWPADRWPRRDIFLRVNLALRAENAMALGHREVAEKCYRLLLPAQEEMIGLPTVAMTLGPAGLTLGRLAEFLGDPARATEHYATAADVARQLEPSVWHDRAGTTPCHGV